MSADTIGRVSAPEWTFAFVDLAGYTALTEQHGDRDAADCAERFYRLTERSLVGYTRIVKTIGDAVMLVASEPASCVATVFALFRACDAEPSFPGLRAGVHAGAAIERGGDYFGAAVNLAARIGAYARSGEVLCGESVATDVSGDERFRAVSVGAVALKNVAHPVAIWSLLPGELPPASALQVDPVCRMRVATPHVSIEHGGRRYSFCSDACADRFRAEPDTFVGALPVSP